MLFRVQCFSRSHAFLQLSHRVLGSNQRYDHNFGRLLGDLRDHWWWLTIRYYITHKSLLDRHDFVALPLDWCLHLTRIIGLKLVKVSLLNLMSKLTMSSTQNFRYMFSCIACSLTQIVTSDKQPEFPVAVSIIRRLHSSDAHVCAPAAILNSWQRCRKTVQQMSRNPDLSRSLISPIRQATRLLTGACPRREIQTPCGWRNRWRVTTCIQLKHGLRNGIPFDQSVLLCHWSYT